MKNVWELGPLYDNFAILQHQKMVRMETDQNVPDTNTKTLSSLNIEIIIIIIDLEM